MSNLFQLDLGMEIIIGVLEAVDHSVDSYGINVLDLNEGEYQFYRIANFQNLLKWEMLNQLMLHITNA
jgi:hypothetical protein